MEALACAKLNLTLDVLGKRADGYHELRMVMTSIDLADRLTLEFGSGAGVSIRTNLGFLPSDKRNLAWLAADAFSKTSGKPVDGLSIAIDKHIPVCAGMAGGSSDAAAVLRALNQWAGEPLPQGALMAAGALVGSDVPYCVLGGTALGSGVQAGVFRVHPGAVCADRPGESAPPPGHNGDAGGAGPRGFGGRGPADVQRVRDRPPPKARPGL